MTNTLWYPDHPAGHQKYCAHPYHSLSTYCSADPADPPTMRGEPSQAWHRDHPQPEGLRVTVTYSQPAVIIAGGWTGMRPAGRARTYRAHALGTDYVNTSKTELQRVIRAAAYRAHAGRVVFTFEPERSE